jgi:hypothetical protein
MRLERNMRARSKGENHQDKYTKTTGLKFVFIGRLAAEGKIDMERVIAHYLRVNECTMEDYRLDNKQARLEWRERSKYGDWQTMIGDYNTLL